MDAMCRNFQYELQKRKIEWYPTLELASMELVAEYAAQGFGGGVDQPCVEPPTGTRKLPLADSPKLTYAAMWQGKPTPLLETFLQGASEMAAELGRMTS